MSASCFLPITEASNARLYLVFLSVLVRGYYLHGLWVEIASHFLAGALNHQEETLQGFLSLLPQTISIG